jgi:hypothetical protein
MSESVECSDTKADDEFLGVNVTTDCGFYKLLRFPDTVEPLDVIRRSDVNHRK